MGHVQGDEQAGSTAVPTVVPTGAGGTSAPVVAWARELAAMSQTALTYAQDPYDTARYRRLRELAAEMLAIGADAPLEVVRGILAAETGHATPKVDVRALVLDGDRMLLVRERSDGGWTLPGGWADVGETPSEAVVREVEEESGFVVRATRLLAVWDKRRHDHPPQPFFVYKLVFLCERLGGAARTSDETDDVAFFAPDALPPLSLDRVTPAQLHRLSALAALPDAPTNFD
jgi:ADP-ribose pyrophosphatase YjhB (NUDIX family)